jgi:predicted  nucleic acid-binding Zn-ribbon protein
MKEVEKRNKTQILREIQDVVDKFFEKKEMIDSLLEEVELLERKYYELKKEVKKG